MVRLALASIVGLLGMAGCGSSGATGDDGGDDDGGVHGDGGGHDGGPPAEPSTRFAATASSWSVPPRGAASGFYSTTWPGGGNAYWFTFDLNGDGKSDLVQTSDPQTGSVWGGDAAATWKVFLNTGSGFGAATTWSVPARGAASGFYSTTWPGGGNAYWFTFDLDGDNKPDLVQTSDPQTGSVWGGDSAATWKVFLNTGSGFAAATTWSVPARGAASGFYSTTWPGGGNAYWFTFDLNGDNKPDLVQTSDPQTGSVWGGDAAATWKVFLNTGSGFAAATTWSVPARGAASGFYSTTWPGGGNAYWFTFDLNGDNKPDLVQTSDPQSGSVWGGDSAATWKVFLNTGSGFAAATTWSVPARGAASGFYSTTWPGGGNAYWFTFDLNGDNKPDLVQTSDPQSGSVWGGDSAATWKTFFNTGTGFAAATTWSVPPRGAASGFYSTTWPGGGNAYWFTFDLDGDRKADLVQTSNPTSGFVWGSDTAASWNVFFGEP